MKKPGGLSMQGCGAEGEEGSKGEPTDTSLDRRDGGGTAPSIKHKEEDENEELGETEEGEKQPFYLCLSTSKKGQVSPLQDNIPFAITANDLALLWKKQSAFVYLLSRDSNPALMNSKSSSARQIFEDNS